MDKNNPKYLPYSDVSRSGIGCCLPFSLLALIVIGVLLLTVGLCLKRRGFI
jgi:hypothetical protein